MDLSTLDIFLAVAEHSSVTRAARHVGRVPSNVTTRIQQLEEELGVPLFSREGKRMSLTREGRLFRSYAGRLVALAREARIAVKPAGPAGVLRVGAMESTAASRLPPVLRKFKELWPEASIRLTMGATRELARAVIAEELDCAFVAKPPDTFQPEWLSSDDGQALHGTLVYQEKLLLILPIGHPSIDRPEDIELQTLAALEPGCTYRNVAEQWLRRGRVIPTMEMTSYHAILAAVAAGHAVGVIPESVLNMLKWTSDIATFELGVVDTLLIRRTDHTAGGALTAFEDLVTGAPAGPRTSQLPH